MWNVTVHPRMWHLSPNVYPSLPANTDPRLPTDQFSLQQSMRETAEKQTELCTDQEKTCGPLDDTTGKSLLQIPEVVDRFSSFVRAAVANCPTRMMPHVLFCWDSFRGAKDYGLESRRKTDRRAAMGGRTLCATDFELLPLTRR